MVNYIFDFNALVLTSQILIFQSNILNNFQKIPEAGGLLCSIKLPDTVLFGAEPEQYGTEGICATMIEPLQKWHLQFNGPMR